LALALFTTAVLTVQGAAMFSRIAPDDPQDEGYTFDIKAEDLKNGEVQFRVRVLADDESKLVDTEEVEFYCGLGTNKVTATSSSDSFDRKLPSARERKSLSCVFAVPKTSLDTTELCFVFVRGAKHMPDADVFYASLRDFYRPETAAPGAARLERENLKIRAAAGDPESERILAYRFQYGEGVTKDLVQAYKWFSLALTGGRADAGKARAEIARQMTPAQIAEGERLAREFKPVAATDAGLRDYTSHLSF
jgi:hypothetical protein